jgi:hypothetical protein
MTKFLSTTSTNYHLEELIKGASDRLILISPFLKLNDRMKELLADKNRLRNGVRSCLLPIFHFGLRRVGRNARPLRDSEQRQQPRNHFSAGA